ncbi:putative leucine-rich repeat-containing protein DDB_G0290503 isoform X3 [Anoplophora glabripennis]|uniref:putative leucine-rich repeat-containing protein DDB_G0290503 isoform X3 n=1 Tax=Anoplophora glabripennis TaxID=217634 RepID=UPI0008740DC5|nr:putative leucine-rich repeat-containing protein DDB_G0290503 isoform X3 [Anoplophora glabripennis]
MHHLYPLAKGDPLCPLGFHPQVRWPTRCKRCFRDYKEHGGKKRDDDKSLRRDASTASTPSLSWNSSDGETKRRSWVSSSNLASDKSNSSSDSGYNNPSSWTSTPDLANLEDDTQPVTTVSIKLPKRKQRPIDTGQRTVSDSFTIKDKSTVFNKTDSLATRAKKLQAIKESSERGRRIQIKEVKTLSEEPTNHDVQFLIHVKAKPKNEQSHSQDSSDNDDTVSLAGTETTDTTLVDAQDTEFRDQLESLRKELETTKTKCDRLEREKSDILLRRLAAMETTTSKTTATEVLKLQQKCNEMQQQLEDHRDEKKSLTLRVKELEEDLEQRPTAQQAQKVADELRSKLLAAETLCEELMDENEDIKKELRDMEEQMDELQDNFREDQAVEYTSLKKDLDQTTKNCRILSFKLRKAERKSTQLEFEKAECEKKLKDISGSGTTLNQIEKIKQLEQDLKMANEVSLRLQKDLDEANQRLKAEDGKAPATKKKAPMLGTIGKNSSTDGKKVSRESLTRGGSQDDPAQLLRDLQDSLEREADLREQLKFAEEETKRLSNKTQRVKSSPRSNKSTQTLYNNVSISTQTLSNSWTYPSMYNKHTQTDDDSESRKSRNILLNALQFRNLTMSKMYQPARSFSPMSTLLSVMGRKLSPTNQRLTPEPPEKGEVSDDDDPAELKLQMELSEQEASVLRKKVEELEADNHRLKAKVKELQDKCTAKSTNRRSLLGSDNGNSLNSQKLKVLEDETNDLRKKLIEKERDCERLHAELSLTQKRSKSMQKSKSLDLDQQTLDLKRQLQVIEQEAAVLRNKVQALESENEKLGSENKRLSLLRSTKSLKTDKNLDKYIDQIATLEVELAERDQKIIELEEAHSSSNVSGHVELKGDYKKFSQRVPKKITSLTSRDQLKTMVSDLEKEIGQMLVAMKSSENEKIKLEEEVRKMKENAEIEKALQELASMNRKYDSMKKELEEEKSKIDKGSKVNEDLNKALKKTKEDLDTANEEKRKLQEKIHKLNEEQAKLNDDKDNLNEEVSKLKANLRNAISKQDEITLLTQKAESLKLSLETKDKETKKLKTELEEKTKLANEITGKAQKILDLEAQLIKYENKYNEIDKKMIEQNKNFENKIDKEKQKLKALENEQTKTENEKKKLGQQVEGLNTKIKGLENTIEQKNKLVKQLEDSLAKEREIVSKTNLKVGELENREINKLKDELSKSKVYVSELESKLEISNKTAKNLEDKIKKSELENKNTKLEHDRKIKELEIDLQNERKKIEVLKTNSDKEQKNRELELAALKAKIKKLELNTGGGVKRELEIKQFQENIEKLENTIDRERQKYDDLTAKYEILEEEHVVTKAKLVMEKETLETQYKNLKKELDQVENELRIVRDTFNTKQDLWVKEKLELDQRLKELSRTSYNGGDLEKQRLKALLEEKQSECEQFKKECDSIHDQMDFMRRENDELKKKLDDYEKVNKIQRNISADSSAMEKEIKQLRVRLNNAEKSKKSDLAELKMRYESQINVVNGELQSLQNQVVRFKREKDTYKHMLESAQKTIGDLKQSPKAARRGSQNINYDEMEETKTKIATLEQQISCMEDELSEARLESSRLKTELVSERSSYEVKLSELHSRVNELEEEKVLSSGRTKIVGLRTRMELAWQKEREEQQRLLQETATLARDLRQTLFEVERERDKERLEAKRKQDLFKKTSEEEQEENKRKITELQCDLLELRDAHAKLRTTNEKLRREKERYEKEREDYRSTINGKKRIDQEDDRKVTALVEQVDTLKQLAPELFFSKDNEAPYTPTPPRRTKSKSRETSPALDRRETSIAPEEKQQQIQYIMQRVVHITEDLRKLQRFSEDEYERERIRRTMGMRRATSTEHENVSGTRYSTPYMRKASVISQGSLKRKSLSLEHTTQSEQKIWNNDDSMSSLTSLELHSDMETGRSRRDASLDSRLSSGSTQSDLGDKKKKKGIMGKLKKLTKSRSIDDQDPGTFSPTRILSSKPNSNSDIEDRGSKRDLKDRITGIFKKSGSSSRSNSVERRHETSSTQRPLVRNGSSTQMAQPSDVDKPQKTKPKKS